MLEEKLVHIDAGELGAHRSMEYLPIDVADQLIQRLREAGMLKAVVKSPRELTAGSQVPIEEMIDCVKECLSTAGWHRIVRVLRSCNHQNVDQPLDLSRPADFLCALELSLAQQEALVEEEKPAGTLDRLMSRMAGTRSATHARDRQQQSLGMSHKPVKPAGVREWFISPRALWAQLSARARCALAQAQNKSANSWSALYIARMERAEIEQDLALARVDKLRGKLHRQLEVFCQEQGIPLPTPYSREEAYCLHYLAAYFVSLAQAEGMIARGGSALARRQITLEGMRAEASVDGRILPSLLDDMSEIGLLREGLWWERIRHKTALILGGVVAAFVGGLSGVVESISDVVITGVARYAPVAAPALLVVLASLVSQTIAGGVPLSWPVLVQYFARAVWNGGIALGAALVAYGSWQYLRERREKRGTASSHTPDVQGGQDDGIETQKHTPLGS